MKELLEHHRGNDTDCTLLSVEFDDPTGYGRIKRGPGGEVTAIVEEGDASAAEKKIREINVGSYFFKAPRLFEALKRVERNQNKKEYYLTDAVGILAAEGKAGAVLTANRGETLGVNTPKDLATAEASRRAQIVEGWMERGVRFRDPATAYIDASVKIGEGTLVLPGTVVEEGSTIGKNCTIGPFARIRGGSKIADGCVIGNFVEIVRSTVGEGSQVKHLTYLGDAKIGARVNVGAGTITANYDGKTKHATVIKDGAQIGSGTVLVAPVTVGKNSKTGAGCVVTRGHDVKDGKTVAGVPARELQSSRTTSKKGRK
jgi:bifunctional UDP-N-acetylglucosamine pyrophosphorylase/glucosamine-1-phosphate N-acetyltransferase